MYMFLHCTYIWKYCPVIASVISFCSYIYNYNIDLTSTLKGIVHPKMSILSLITLLCHLFSEHEFRFVDEVWELSGSP